MRVVLDTNVLVSGLLNAEGVCGRILRLAFNEAFRLCVDERILAEYEAVLPRPRFHIGLQDVADALSVIRTISETVAAPPLDADLPDPSDLPFLEVATAAEATLVTGNLKHFAKKVRKGVPAATPRAFIEMLRRG